MARKFFRRTVRHAVSTPHQNMRECARRVGGQVWIDYKNARREARGLPPL